MDISQESEIRNPLLEAALSCYRAGEYKEALRLAKKSIKKNKNNLASIVLAGLISQENKQIEIAEQYFRQALAQDPEYSDGLKSLGLLLASLDRKSEGLLYLIKYLRQDHWDDLTIGEKIKSLGIELGFPAEVHQVLKEAWGHTLAPRVGRILAQYLHQRKDYKEAIRIMEFAIKRDSYPDMLSELAEYLAADRQYDNAFHYMQLAIMNADNSVFDTKYADYLEEWRDDTDNVVGYLVPESVVSTYYSRLIIYAYYSSRFEKVIDIFEGSHLTNWDDQMLSIYMESIIELNQLDKAIEKAREFLEGFKKTEEASFDIACMLDILRLKAKAEIAKGDLKAAIEDYRSSIRINPQGYQAYFDLSDLLVQENRIHEAIEVLEEGFQKIKRPNPQWREEGQWFEPFEYFDHLSLLLRLYLRNPQKARAWKKIEPFIGNEENIVLGRAFEKLIDDLIKISSEGSSEISIEPYQLETINEIYHHYHGNSYVVRFLFIINYCSGKWEEACQVLQQALDMGQNDFNRLEFANNLGYINLLQGKFTVAEEYLTQALQAAEPGSLMSTTGGLGVAFFLDGNLIRGDWDSKEKFGKFAKPQWSPAPALLAVISNLITLALARGDPDWANVLIIITLLIKAKIASRLEDLSLLFLARYRNDQKTAQFAWRQLLSRDPENPFDEPFRTLYPDFYAWLTQASIRQADELLEYIYT